MAKKQKEDTRSPEWHDEFDHLLGDLDDAIRALVLDGSIEICPGCHELSAYAWQDCTAYVDNNHYDPEKGKIAHIGTSSCFEFECGHCRNSYTAADSPINHPCYTHSDD